MKNKELKPYGWWYPISTYANTADGYYAGFKESIEHLKGILINEVKPTTEYDGPMLNIIKRVLSMGFLAFHKVSKGMFALSSKH